MFEQCLLLYVGYSLDLRSYIISHFLCSSSGPEYVMDASSTICYATYSKYFTVHPFGAHLYLRFSR